MPRAVLQGWLIGFVFVGGVPLGAVALMCVARLTGGRWAVAARPVLLRALAATPLLCLAFLPVLFGAGLIFSWASHPDAAGKERLLLYLNTGFFALRGGLALIGLSVVAVLLLLGSGGRLLAALGLVFYAVAVDFVSVDWMLSLSPRFSSSAFGAEMAIQQILAALALLLVWPAGAKRGRCARSRRADARSRVGRALHGNDVSDHQLVRRRTRPCGMVSRSRRRSLAVARALRARFRRRRPDRGSAVYKSSRVAGRFADRRRLASSGVALHDLWLMAPNTAQAAGPAAMLGVVATAALAIAFSSWLQARLASGRRGDGD